MDIENKDVKDRPRSTNACPYGLGGCRMWEEEINSWNGMCAHQE